MKGQTEKKRDPTLGNGQDTTIAVPTKEQFLLHLDTLLPNCHEAVAKFGREMAKHLEDLKDPKIFAKRVLNYIWKEFPEEQKFSVVRYEIDALLPKIAKRLFADDPKACKLVLDTIIKGFRYKSGVENPKHKIQGGLL